MIRHAVLVASIAAIQSQAPKEERWDLQYERQVTTHMQSVIDTVRARLFISPAAGDSVSGRLVATVAGEERELGVVRGVRSRQTLTLKVMRRKEEQGFIGEQWAAFMDFLKETIHDIVPVYSRLDLTIKGDELSGTRRVLSVDGQVMDPPRPVHGVRAKP